MDSFSLQAFHIQHRKSKQQERSRAQVTFQEYIKRKARESADQTTAKDFQKNGIMTFISGTRRKR